MRTVQNIQSFPCRTFLRRGLANSGPFQGHHEYEYPNGKLYNGTLESPSFTTIKNNRIIKNNNYKRVRILSLRFFSTPQIFALNVYFSDSLVVTTSLSQLHHSESVSPIFT
ncbi:hypothetical protein ANN_23870 [Periplaneta americana]|uniref:Uncharacterized protein n=1 Tax=Periplaneta americana TaxID=6978 RepID=A0ABQ8S230_PERAM|nr:hypothetical protein ANN_23870 [Periplaneta americana]